MRRNVDLWAIGLLLVIAGLVSEVRQSNVVLHQSKQLVELTTEHIAPFSEVVHLPKLCLTRD